MRIEATRQTVGAGQDLYRGKVYDLPDIDAKRLIRCGKAVLVSEHVEPEPLPAETDDASPAKRGRKPKNANQENEQ